MKKKVRFGYLKLAAVVAVLTMALVNGGLPSDDVFRNVWIYCDVGQVCCPFTN